MRNAEKIAVRLPTELLLLLDAEAAAAGVTRSELIRDRLEHRAGPGDVAVEVAGRLAVLVDQLDADPVAEVWLAGAAAALRAVAAGEVHA